MMVWILLVRNSNYGKEVMTITYGIWQGSSLLSVGNTASDIKDIDTLMATLNESEIGKKRPFTATITRVETK